MKRADKISKTAGHPVCPYCQHPNNVYQFNAHKEGERINASCDRCGAEYTWERYVVELYISEPMPEPVVMRDGPVSPQGIVVSADDEDNSGSGPASPQGIVSICETPGKVQDEGEIR